MKKTITILTAIVLIFSSSVCYAAEMNFTDVQTTDWFYKNLQELTEKNISSGYPDGTFKPSNTLKFEEFLKMLIVATDGEPAEQKEGQEWHQNYIDKALESKYISEQQEAFIGQNIDRQTMAEILYNVLTEKEDIKSYTDEELQYLSDKLTDVDKTDVKTLTINGIGVISGYPDGTFKPTGTLTRAEAVAVLSRVINKDLRNPVKIISKENGIIDAADLDKIPVEDTNYNKLKEYVTTYLRDEPAKNIKAGDIDYKVENVIKADISMFPIKYGDIVITGIEKLPGEKSPFDSDDAIILHAYAWRSNCNKDNSSERFWGKYIPDLMISYVDKSGKNYIGSLVHWTESITDKTKSDEIKRMFPNFVFLMRDPLWSNTIDLNQSFTLHFPIGLNDIRVEDLDKIIFMDRSSTRDVLETDVKDINVIR